MFSPGQGRSGEQPWSASEFEGVRYSDKLLRLLQLLAHQIGSQVSTSELGRLVGMSKNNFWRTYDGQEIDLVEDRAGKLSAFEIKWGDRRVRKPSAWAAAYPDSSFTVVNRDNYLDFIL